MFGINNQGSLFERNIFTHVVPNLDFVTVHEYKRRNFTFLSLPHNNSSKETTVILTLLKPYV